MDDKFGLKAARRIAASAWAMSATRSCSRTSISACGKSDSSPARRIDFHIHYHPYLIVSLGGGENEIETIFGNKIPTEEPLGSFVFINEMRAVHRLTNKSKVTYLSRLIEIKAVTWNADKPA